MSRKKIPERRLFFLNKKREKIKLQWKTRKDRLLQYQIFMYRFILLIKRFQTIIIIIKKRLVIFIRRLVTLLLLYKQRMRQHLKLKKFISRRYRKIKKILSSLYFIQGNIYKIKFFNTQNRPNFMFIDY